MSMLPLLALGAAAVALGNTRKGAAGTDAPYVLGDFNELPSRGLQEFAIKQAMAIGASPEGPAAAADRCADVWAYLASRGVRGVPTSALLATSDRFRRAAGAFRTFAVLQRMGSSAAASNAPLTVEELSAISTPAAPVVEAARAARAGAPRA